MLKILAALLIFGALILIHEFGHYIMARIFKVGINEFSIGMGPKLLQKKSKKTNIAYSLRLLPIGGYVSMVGEDEASDDENALDKKTIWQRFLIMFAGAFMNIVLGVILTCVLVGMSKNLYTTEIDSFVENAVTEEAGLMAGDVILKLGNTSVNTAYQLQYTLWHDATEPIDVTVLRDGKKLVIKDVKFPTTEESGVTFALRDFYFAEEEKNFVNIVKQSFYQSLTSVTMIWESLIDLVTGKYGMEAMSGPIGITGEIGNAVTAGDGGASLISLTALIALNLGIFNLLPFPALDGGRIFFLLIELVRGKPVKKEIEGYINFAGLAILMLFMLLVTFNDVTRLIK